MCAGGIRIFFYRFHIRRFSFNGSTRCWRRLHTRNELSFACEAQHVSGSPFNFTFRQQCRLLFQSSGYETNTSDAVNAYLLSFSSSLRAALYCRHLAYLTRSSEQQNRLHSEPYEFYMTFLSFISLLNISQKQLLLPNAFVSNREGLKHRWTHSSRSANIFIFCSFDSLK